MSCCTPPVVVLLPPLPHPSHFHLLFVYLPFLVFKSMCSPFVGTNWDTVSLNCFLIPTLKKTLGYVRVREKVWSWWRALILQLSRAYVAFSPLQLKKKISELWKSVQTIKINKNQVWGVRKSCKVGHKVGRTLLFPKVSPTAASLKWFINSHECIAASRCTSILRRAVSFLYGNMCTTTNLWFWYS